MESTGETSRESKESAPDGSRAYAFGQFRLDLSREELVREGVRIPLRPKAFDVLHYLVRHPKRVVSRDELFEAVWTNLVVTDDSLTQCLIEIRKALGEEGREIIRTVPRRGYLWEAEVEVLGPPDQEGGSEAAQSATWVGDRLPSRWTIAALLVLGLAVAAIWSRFDTTQERSTEQSADWQPLPASIAVLPFVDMSEAGDQEYLAHGLAEEILNLLAQSSSLTVIARTSSFSFQDTNADIGTIARKLNVAHVLEGSVRKAGDRVRLTAQLVDGGSGTHIWSETYEERVQDVFALQDKVARGVADVLEVQLTREASHGNSAAARAASPDPLAWELYSRGRLFYSRRAEGDILRAQRNFEQALDIDPAFADAWVSLAATINLRRADAFVTKEERLPGEVALPLMRDALEKALALDPDNPEALWRVSYFTWQVDGEVDQTVKQLREAMDLGQNHALVQAMMGGFAFDSGYRRLALPFATRAVMLDPINAIHQRQLGHYLYAAGRLAESGTAFRQAMELNPSDELSLAELAWIKIHERDLGSAAELVGQLPPGPDRDHGQAIVKHLQGDHEAADEEALQRLLSLPPEQGAERLAYVYAMRGEKDEAFRWLSIATQTVANSPLGRSARSELTKLETSPFLRPLHDDERWAAWRTDSSQLLLDEVDRQVVAMLRDHLERHPELYAQTGPALDLP